METSKLSRIVNKLHLTNILKIGIILIVLILVARAFIPEAASVDSKQISRIIRLNKLTENMINPTFGVIDTNNMRIDHDSVEGFTNMAYTYYGNQLTLQDPTNKPIYRANTCTFNFDGLYRIEAFKIMFNNNVKAGSSIQPFKNNSNLPVYIQYLDGNGSLRYIQSSNNTGGIPNFNNSRDLQAARTAPQVSKGALVDENNLAIYTSSIVITIGDSANMIDSYQDACEIGYISNWVFWGSSRDMLSKTDFEQLSPSLGTQTFTAASSNNTNTSFNQATNTDTYSFTYSNDYLTYGLSLTYTVVPINSTGQATTTTPATSACSSKPMNTDSPFKLMLTYNNGLYPGNNFKLNQHYIIRNDPLVPINPTSTTYIQFPQPFITNGLTISVPRANVMDSSGRTLRLNITGLGAYGSAPSNSDITNYQKNVNLALTTSNQSSQSQDICPSMDDLVSKQNQAQAVCDNLEYQDKIKSEKIRLEKNKQYLLKLQQQQKQIDQLNTVIQTLDNKRQSRATTNDQARVLQYQQQRGVASTVRDIANQRLQSQAANQLYMDVNINTE